MYNAQTELKEVRNVWIKETDEILHVSTSDGETIDNNSKDKYNLFYPPRINFRGFYYTNSTKADKKVRFGAFCGIFG